MTDQDNTMKGMYAVRDDAVNTFHAPFYANNDNEAKRMIGEACKDENSMLAQNPHDFHLFCVGHFCPETGNVVPEPAPVSVSSIIEIFQSVMAMLASIAKMREAFTSDPQDGQPDNK